MDVFCACLNIDPELRLRQIMIVLTRFCGSFGRVKSFASALNILYVFVVRGILAKRYWLWVKTGGVVWGLS